MCKQSIRTYTDLIGELYENSNLTEVCGIKPNSIPIKAIISRAADEFWVEIFRNIVVDKGMDSAKYNEFIVALKSTNADNLND